MEYETILFEVENNVATVTFNRPKVLNALNRKAIVELNHAISRCEHNKDIKAVILTGGGDKAFVVGADINELKRLRDGDLTDAMEFEELGNNTFRLVETIGKPVIAAVNGYALGGGLELCMACDVRFASDKARFGQPEILLGAIPGWGGTQRLARLIGIGRAKELIMSGKQVDAERAYEMGLVNRLFPAEQLMDEARSFAEELTRLPSLAIKMAKDSINYGYDVAFETARRLELQCTFMCFCTQDLKEGVAAFLEKRRPSFLGK